MEDSFFEFILYNKAFWDFRKPKGYICSSTTPLSQRTIITSSSHSYFTPTREGARKAGRQVRERAKVSEF